MKGGKDTAMNDFSIGFSLSDSGYLTAVRLVVGAICSVADVDVDAAEDFKVCVTESCIILKNCGSERAEISFRPDKERANVTVTVSGVGGTPCAGDNEFSLALISALVAHCDIEKQGEAIVKVCLRLC